MSSGFPHPADPQASEPVQVGECALHETALGTQAGAVLGATTGDQRLHAHVPDQTAVLVVIVAAVAQHHVRPASRLATPATHGRHGLKERDQLGDVNAVAPDQRSCRRTSASAPPSTGTCTSREAVSQSRHRAGMTVAGR